MGARMDRDKLVKFISAVLTDLIVVFLCVYAIHYVFYYPMIWFALIGLFCIAVRWEDVYKHD